MDNLSNFIKKNLFVFIIIVSLIFSLVFIIPYFCYFHYGFSEDQALWGLFGNYIGGILGPFFSFAAFIAIAYSVNEMKKQNETLEIQRFENTYFQMLKFHNEVVNSITFLPRYTQGEGKREGLVAFQLYYLELRGRYKHLKEDPNLSITVEIDIIKEAFKNFFNEYQTDLEHCFLTVLNIVEFLNETKILQDNNYYYARFLSSQISPYEKLLIIYFCLSDNSNKYKGKIEPLLKHNDLYKNYLLRIDHADIIKQELSPDHILKL